MVPHVSRVGRQSVLTHAMSMLEFLSFILLANESMLISACRPFVAENIIKTTTHKAFGLKS